MAVKFTVQEQGTDNTFILTIPMGKRLGTDEIQLYEDWVPFYDNIPNKPTWAELSTSISKNYNILNTNNVRLSAGFSRQVGSSERNPKIQVEISFWNSNPTPDFMYMGGYSKPAYGDTWNNPFKNSMLAYDVARQEIICFQPEYYTYEDSYINDSYGYVTWYTMLASPKPVEKGTYKSLPEFYVGSQKVTNTSSQKIEAPIGSTIQVPFMVWHNTELYQKLFSIIKPSQYPDNPNDDEDSDPTNPAPSPSDDSSDAIPIPPKPSTGVVGTGFVTLYNPSPIDIRNLAYFMWSGEFTDLIKKMFSAPFDCLIGLKLLYAPLTTGASQTIWLGNVESDVSAPKITDQFTDFDCGSIQLSGYFESFLDYAPYTKVTLFLPFIGYKELNVDEVMNATLHLTYRIDAYSGSCVSFLHVSKNIGNTQLNSVLYEFDGNAAMDIPFTSGDMSRYVAAVLGTAASTAGAVVSMAAGAKLATSTVPQTSNSPWEKNPIEKKTVSGLTDLGNGSAELIGGKPHIQRGGSLAGANASMAIKTPYVIIERPIQQMPSDYANFIGIPLNMTRQLSEVSGFTVVSQVFMASSSATDDELNMIDSLLRQGVII